MQGAKRRQFDERQSDLRPEGRKQNPVRKSVRNQFGYSVYPNARERVTGGFSRVAFGPRLLARPRPFANLPPEAVSRAEGLIIHVTSTPHHKESTTAVARRIFHISVPYERYPASVTVNYRSSSVINCPSIDEISRLPTLAAGYRSCSRQFTFPETCESFSLGFAPALALG